MDIIYVFSPTQVSIISFLWSVFFFFLNQKKNNDNKKASLTSRHLQFTPLPVNLKKVVTGKDQFVLPQILGLMERLHEFQMILLIDFKDILWTVPRHLILFLLGKQQQKPKQKLNQITYRWNRDSTFPSYLLFYFTFELHKFFNKSLPLLFFIVGLL